jgi:membrane protease YdiL (CAAX protease family)
MTRVSNKIILIFKPLSGFTEYEEKYMSGEMSSNPNRIKEPDKDNPGQLSHAFQIGLFILMLACSLAVFLLEPKYYQLFPTNGNLFYTGIVSAFFLAAALLLKLNTKHAKFWPIAFAFFIASVVNLITILFGSYNGAFTRFLGASGNTNQYIALSKVYETLMAVIPIFVLTWISGAGLGSLFLKKGNMNRKWGLGIGFLVLANFLTSSLIFFGNKYQLSSLGSVIICGLVFSASNSLLEELWVRGLFLKKMVPLIGATGAVTLTSIVFASLHFLAVAYLPAAIVPIFVVNTLTLGLACSILMLKTDSIWGAFLIHAAADLFLFIATLAVY